MKAQLLEPTADNLILAVRALRKGEVVGMPTETVYGLAGLAFMPKALGRIFEAKERPTFDPLIIHVHGAKDVQGLGEMKLVDLAQLGPKTVERVNLLISRFWPGPLTLVLPKHEDVPDLATSGLPTVAIRMPRHPVAQRLLATAGAPLAAPSANRFGRISPTTAQAVLEELGDRIPYVLEGGQSEIGLESTIVSVDSSGELSLLRPGGIPSDEIQKVIGVKLQPAPKSANPVAPGMLESHYAPRKPMFLLPATLSESMDLAPLKKFSRLALLLQKSSPETEEWLRQETGAEIDVAVLSQSGDLQEIAQRLFAEMRRLDSSASEVIVAEPCLHGHGLGHAIADRLRKASKPL